jgi:hypothetical protein
LHDKGPVHLRKKQIMPTFEAPLKMFETIAGLSGNDDLGLQPAAALRKF